MMMTMGATQALPGAGKPRGRSELPNQVEQLANPEGPREWLKIPNVAIARPQQPQSTSVRTFFPFDFDSLEQQVAFRPGRAYFMQRLRIEVVS